MERIENLKNKILQGNCLDVLKYIPDNSVDSIVTDPPYGLSFMGKKWDYDVPSVEVWKECLRVLKPGAFLLSFAGTRTYHRMTCAIEDAGFEIRDMISWLYGSGFPKSLNIGKQVDKILGNEREITGEKIRGDVEKAKENGVTYAKADANKNNKDIFGYGKEILTKGNSEWEGWGTALKPACEPIVVARKPLSEKNVALNVLRWGTGGINIDECRISHNEPEKFTDRTPRVEDNVFSDDTCGFKKETNHIASASQQGRFPANIILDEKAGKILDEQTGLVGGDTRTSKSTYDKGIWGNAKPVESKALYNDKGGASRFFYCAKASKSERNLGCEELEGKESPITNQSWRCKKCNKFQLSGNGDICKCEEPEWIKPISKNNHPTVKPIKLMQYLVRLVTKKGGIALDPFGGSGTTGIACIKEEINYILIEKDRDYIKIAEARLKPFIEQKSLNVQKTKGCGGCFFGDDRLEYICGERLFKDEDVRLCSKCSESVHITKNKRGED